MLGGYQIINLSNIDLTIGTSQVSITDKDVLAQLRELREHIEDNYNFAIPLNRKLKPVLLRLRDKKNGEKQEVSVWANLSIITNNKTFKIEALVDSVSMKAIQIEVVFQQLTDDDGNPYWDIKTAKYLYTENIGIGGDLEVDDLKVGGDIQVTGDTSVGGALTVTGNVTGAKFIGDVLMENIKDEDGHSRFIEGVITQRTIEGLTMSYGKWSLSGTHLSIVYAGSLEANATISDGGTMAEILDLPEWLLNKIVAISGTTIDLKIINFYQNDYTYNTKPMNLMKFSNGLSIRNMTGTLTYTSDRTFRIAFDLLIDNE